MRYYRHSLDHVLQRVRHEAAVPDLLWPSGEWVSDPSADLMHYGAELREEDAQTFADRRVGRHVDLRASALTRDEHAAELRRLRTPAG